ncbi:universal stress protein [Nocardioides sp. zg-DK7169]|uniref:universal stress protein n=1 Tax=Nocardioides sp. zg-DK7169 TaxID=2736600 RepID=UPI0015582081|nr:universal stress protein [Nocardioides sp. zg-DK7169]NPC96860.1 universal stress protein [Nocardioides sp. zg-DK7169]
MSQSPTSRPATILLAVNGVDDHGPGVAFAAQEARRRGAGIHVVHVVTPSFPGMPVTSDVGLDGEEMRVLGSSAVEHCQEAVREALAGADLAVTGEVLHGRVAATLVESSHDAELVVLTRTHPRPVPALSAMSVVHGVAARADCAVAVVPREWESAREDAPVVVGVEGAEESGEMVRAVLTRARRSPTRVELEHAWWYSDAFDTLVFAGDEGEAEAQRQRERLEIELGPLLSEFTDVEAALVITHAPPAQALVADSERARQVVVGRHHPALPLGSHLGPITRVVLREAMCPVVVETGVDPSIPRPGRHAARG